MTVWCAMSGGGNTVIQSRSNGPDDSFAKTYAEYQVGFGNISSSITNYWLGLDNMYTLLTNRNYALTVDLCCNGLPLQSVVYNSFSIGDSNIRYRLNVSSGTGGSDGLNNPFVNTDNGSQFYAPGVTYSNDPPLSICQSLNRNNNGGWWFGSCLENPNGYLYNASQFLDQGSCRPDGSAGHGIGVTWNEVITGITKMRMKIVVPSMLRSMDAIQNLAVGYCASA